MKNTQAINVKAGNAVATGSVTVSDSMPGVPCPDPAGYKYVGARYVPLFAEPAEWNINSTYEPLTIVLNEGNSYTSKQYVPVGIQIDNEEYWAQTGNYNAQVEQYRQEVKELKEKYDNASSVSLRMLGCKDGDEVSDILQNALDNYNLVYLDGEYLLNKNVTISTDTALYNGKLSLRDDPSYQGHVIAVTGGNVMLSGLVIDDMVSGKNENGIGVGNLTSELSIIIERCRINSSQTPISFEVIGETPCVSAIVADCNVTGNSKNSLQFAGTIQSAMAMNVKGNAGLEVNPSQSDQKVDRSYIANCEFTGAVVRNTVNSEIVNCSIGGDTIISLTDKQLITNCSLESFNYSQPSSALLIIANTSMDAGIFGCKTLMNNCFINDSATFSAGGEGSFSTGSSAQLTLGTFIRTNASTDYNVVFQSPVTGWTSTYGDSKCTVFGKIGILRVNAASLSDSTVVGTISGGIQARYKTPFAVSNANNESGIFVIENGTITCVKAPANQLAAGSVVFEIA